MPQEQSGTPREASTQRAPRLVSLGVMSPPPPMVRAERCHRGAQALHATWTVIVRTDRQQLVGLWWAVRHQFYSGDKKGRKQARLTFDDTLNLLTVASLVHVAEQP
ncbi:unnamed protein product [Pleuronectes platessa]|uniref:Uncharacterized protein n=1 Tax=Pleuronectes platessa TaxID=8262 RepID=A0A9N7U9H9_PLEPL|nr:unnamed protein product [Pleuronectes platessa]